MDVFLLPGLETEALTCGYLAPDFKVDLQFSYIMWLRS